MPPWGRPPGGRGVGRYMEEVEDVYRFQEVDSEDEKHGVLLDAGYHRDFSGKPHFNPDELFFNDMDIRAWERRMADLDGLAYGDDYGYLEDEGYYEDAGEMTMSVTEYEDMVFQGVLDKIRLARATGDPDVQLTTEELEIYQVKLLGPRAPAARPQPPKPRHASAPTVSGSTTTAVASTSSTAPSSGSASARAKKSSRRTSIFGSRRPKEREKEKSSNRTRAPSMSSNASNQQHPPGFVVPGPNGQPVFAPINACHGSMAHDPRARPANSPSRPSSRSASTSSDRLAPAKGPLPNDIARGLRQAPTPPRISPPRDMPGAFPSGSPRSYRAATPPQLSRPASSSSRQSTQDNADPRLPSGSRPRSASIQQAPKLVPLAVPEYKHHTAEPFQYQVAGQLATSSQPQYARRVVSNPADGNYTTAMPRRVPVPVQRATGVQGVQGSQSDPAIVQRAEVSDVDESAGVLADVVPSADDKSYKVQTSKSTTKEGSSGGKERDSERRKKSSRSKRKH
ncbi:hypothetical protein K458DRAFT_419084 [Lentithecium fluviatile CBS 122367]|uniref:Uncharacterized protein n=1 Tax=Lentithecium fluviatile CBS 122367 TaxID=1168545 RepID=A0A6G1IZ07_9PLEO|nr:hypothetical protein K458DRAFT_419084 [Lentithecium fluviatile CBS 122367]